MHTVNMSVMWHLRYTVFEWSSTNADGDEFNFGKVKRLYSYTGGGAIHHRRCYFDCFRRRVIVFCFLDDFFFFLLKYYKPRYKPYYNYKIRWCFVVCVK